MIWGFEVAEGVENMLALWQELPYVEKGRTMSEGLCTSLFFKVSIFIPILYLGKLRLKAVR